MKYKYLLLFKTNVLNNNKTNKNDYCKPQEWLNLNWPNYKALDQGWTMERYDYPPVVRNWIKENWIKVSDINGGTYHEPKYHRHCTESKKDLSSVNKIMR